jgi:hypothetical protein
MKSPTKFSRIDRSQGPGGYGGCAYTTAASVFKDRVPTQDARSSADCGPRGPLATGKLNMRVCLWRQLGGRLFRQRHNPGHSILIGRVFLSFGRCRGSGSLLRRAGVRYRGQPAAGRYWDRGIEAQLRSGEHSGVIPLAWSLGRGPMTHSRDAALVPSHGGYDAEDTASTDSAVADYAGALRQDKSLRVGIARTHFFDSLHPEIQAAMDAALSVLRSSQTTRPRSSGRQRSVLRAGACSTRTRSRVPVARRTSRGSVQEPRSARWPRERPPTGSAATLHSPDLRRRRPRVHPAPVPRSRLELLAEPDQLQARRSSRCGLRPFNALGLPTSPSPAVSLVGIAHGHADPAVLEMKQRSFASRMPTSARPTGTTVDQPWIDQRTVRPDGDSSRASGRLFVSAVIAKRIGLLP